MPASHGYPRPQLRRAEWTNLNGAWDFALDPDGQWTRPEQIPWRGSILVPFAPESPASGVAETGFFQACWYRRTFEAPPLAAEQRLVLHFGAVDDEATIWINDQFVGRHEGGYTPFYFDITEALVGGAGEQQTLVVRATDDPHDLAKPRGKQDWRPSPHAIWYPRTSGIWQTVWLEQRGSSWIDSLRWSSSLESWEVGLELSIGGPIRDDLRISIQLRVGEGLDRVLLADDTYHVIRGEVHRRIALSDPGIDDVRNELLWSPASPTLIRVRVRLWATRGELLDDIESYTALRTVGTQGDRFLLNGQPYPLRMVLDQGYWPETGLTPPDDDALRRDVELAKTMGFNGVRKHQKVEDPRYLYWADTLGLLVWEEMPSAYRFTRRSIERLTQSWTEAVRRDISHPCIVAWVPFNESWGIPDLPNNPAHRNYVQALYHLTKTLDPSRPTIGNDGWESSATDIIGIHDYDQDPARLAVRYGGAEQHPHLFTHERPAGRLLTLDGHAPADLPLILSEFGGISLASDGDIPEAWGYGRAADAADFAARYVALLTTVRSFPLLAGFCYTQFADTYQETNGLLTADRTPKIPLAEIAAATRGIVSTAGGTTELRPEPSSANSHPPPNEEGTVSPPTRIRPVRQP